MRQLAVHQEEELACVVLPQEELSLLVPNDCVAEILPWRRVKPVPGMPRWCVGTLGWRGQTVVVVDFQLLTSDSGQARVNRRALVVMHRTTKREGMSFYAIASSGLPRLLYLAEDEVRDVEDPGDQGQAEPHQGIQHARRDPVKDLSEEETQSCKLRSCRCPCRPRIPSATACRR